MSVYMAFHPAGQTAATVTRCTGGLLPHLLTLTRLPRRTSGYFLLRYPTLTNGCLSTVRYPLLPGLSSATPKAEQRQSQLLQNFKEQYKINYFCGFNTDS